MTSSIENFVAGAPRSAAAGLSEMPCPGQWRLECPTLAIRRLEDGASVYRQGDEQERVLGIVEGRIRLSRASGFGREVTLAFLGPGELFGPGLARRRRACESAICRGPTELYEIATDDFHRLLGRRPEVAAHLLQCLVARDERTVERLERAASLPVWDRVVATLLDLMARHGAACHHGHEVHVALAPRELADLSATEEGQVLWVLNDLEWRRIVRYTQNHICAARLHGLARVARDARRLPPTDWPD